MIITETYKNNIKEIEKFLYTFNFSEESENRIRQYIENPLSVLNDDIKELFKKYDDKIVDFRIQLPSSMIKERKTTQKEIFLIMSIIVDCLEEDDQFKYTVDEFGFIKPDFQVTASTISNNFFKIRNDKRKVWRYLDSKVTSIAKRMYERWYDKKTFKWDNATNETIEYIDIKGSAINLGPFFKVMEDYLKTLGSKNTSLKTKITKFISMEQSINVGGMSHSEIINLLADNILRPAFNIMQEIISAKMLDLEKYKLYLSFNAFDWLLASTGETWHSCIDMQSSHCYGTGLLGMCGCPDWGELLYTDGTEKEFGGIKSYHIITRSWICYTNQKDFEIINWYPKDMRNTVEFTDGDDFRFSFERFNENRRSMSSWSPIVFKNGAFAWIYSDSNRFMEDKDPQKVYFKFEDAYGLPRHVKRGDKILRDSYAIDEVIRTLSRNYNCIWDAVKSRYKIDTEGSGEHYTCDCCGSSFEDENDLTYIESEDIMVCSDCLSNHFFWCEECESYHRYDGDSVEVYFGESAWSYDLICQSCLESHINDGSIFYDEIEHKYYKGMESETIIYADGLTKTVSPFTIAKLESRREIFKHSDDNWYNYEEEGAEA